MQPVYVVNVNSESTPMLYAYPTLTDEHKFQDEDPALKLAMKLHFMCQL